MLDKAVRIALVMGGRSAERDISLQSGEAVRQCLDGAGFPVCAVDLRPEDPPLEQVQRLAERLREFKADVVYLALHGPLGEDGTIQGLLELAGLPYTGSGVLATAIGNDKLLAKQLFVANKITTPKGALVKQGQTPEASPLPLPVVVKPRALGSSLGVSVVDAAAGFPAALKAAAAYGQDVLVEQFVEGREIQVVIQDGELFPLVEIVPKNRLYDFEAKYTTGAAEHRVPAPLPKKQYEAAQRLGLAVYETVGCRGTARVELIAEHTGTLYALEVNTLPGMTVNSIVPEAAREAGVSFLDLITREIERAIGRRAERAAPPLASAGAGGT